MIPIYIYSILSAIMATLFTARFTRCSKSKFEVVVAFVVYLFAWAYFFAQNTKVDIQARGIHLKNWLWFGLMLILLNVFISSTVQRFKCKKLTESELFIKLPANFMWQFKNC